MIDEQMALFFLSFFLSVFLFCFLASSSFSSFNASSFVHFSVNFFIFTFVPFDADGYREKDGAGDASRVVDAHDGR
jgi:hypothetical protein